MDRLVKPDVKELNLVFIRREKCCTTFKLTNLMHTMNVAVFIETTNPFLLLITSPFYVIPPLGTASFTLESRPSDQPLISSTLDTVIVRTSMLVTGKTDQESLRFVFSKPGPHIFKDAIIPVSFVGPHVVDFLILSTIPKAVNIPFLLSQSVSFCNESDLISLLKSAVITGNAYIVTFLIKNGSDVNYRDVEGKSMMSLAILSKNVDVVRAMVESNFVVDYFVDRFLHEAASVNGVDIMEVLCMSYLDIDMNSVNSRGQTALHIAANCGYIEVLEFLTTLGSNPNVVDNNGWTPLHYASIEGHVAVVEFLLNSSTYIKYALTNEGKSAIALAYENDHTDLYNMLYLGDVLHKSATTNDVNGLIKCLAEGGEVNGKDQNGWTALHRAAFKGRIECVELLLNHGARIDLVDNNGFTPLHLAVDAGHAKVAMVLLAAREARANTKSLNDHIFFDIDCSKNHRSFVTSIC